MSREVPMLFSGHLVRAILGLDGKLKTQTRRPIKGIPKGEEPEAGAGIYCPLRVDKHGEEYPGEPVFGIYGGSQGAGWDVPATVRPGDTLWVRETWTLLHTHDADGVTLVPFNGDRVFADRYIAYRATSEVEFCDGDGFSGDFADKSDMPKWRPSIHMPRWAARIFLEVTAVRAERVCDISEADATAEGFADSAEFTRAWAGIYGSCEGWCWVIEFKRKEVANGPC